MPFKEKRVKVLREELVLSVLSGKQTKSAAARQYGVSRPTVDLWIKRHKNGLSMENLSKTPHKSPKRTNPDMEALVVSKRNDYPDWKSSKIKLVLERDGVEGVPAASTITSILHRHNLITKEASRSSINLMLFDLI